MSQEIELKKIDVYFEKNLQEAIIKLKKSINNSNTVVMNVVSLLLLISFVNATSIYAGNTFNFNIDKCMNYTINITNATLGEWYNDGCNETNISGYFTNCSCSNDYLINLTPQINSLGFYNITIYWDYNTTTDDGDGGAIRSSWYSSGSGGGSIKRKPIYNIIPLTKKTTVVQASSPTPTITPTITPAQTWPEGNNNISINIPTPNLKPQEKPSILKPILIFAIFIVIFIVILFFILLNN
jgi:hypothetical protein